MYMFDLQVEMLCLELCCFVCVIRPSQLSGLSSSVGSICLEKSVDLILKHLIFL